MLIDHVQSLIYRSRVCLVKSSTIVFKMKSYCFCTFFKYYGIIDHCHFADLIHEHYTPEGDHTVHEILQKLTDYCGKSVFNYTEHETDLYKWDFYNSFYFAYTVVSTIGE